MPHIQQLLLSIVALATLASFVRPPFPEQIWLQHLPTALALVLLVGTARRLPLSNAAFTCIVAFLLLHVLGARYIYSYVPYDAWSEWLLGLSLTEYFGFRRNHYDRLVHLAFGLLAVLPVWDVCTRYGGLSARLAYYLAFEFVLAASMLYELLEWGLAVLMSPETAETYNGQQGDMWDAQKDMALALVGAMVGVGLMMAVRHVRFRIG